MSVRHLSREFILEDLLAHQYMDMSRAHRRGHTPHVTLKQHYVLRLHDDVPHQQVDCCEYVMPYSSVIADTGLLQEQRSAIC